MNCPQCQSPNIDDSAFCSACGARLAPAPAFTAGGGSQPANRFGAPGGFPPADGFPPPGGYNGPGTPYPPRPATAGTSFQLDLGRLTRVDQIVAGASLIAMISIWLPWYSVSWGSSVFQSSGSASFSGTGLHGWLWLEFVVALSLIAYLGLRAGLPESRISLPIAHAPLLIVGTGLQLLLILIAFADIPYGNEGMGWGWAAFIGLLAALAAAGPVLVPAARSYLESRNAGTGPRL